MATKTISLKIAAYEKLRNARRHPDESFSDVVLRATWSEETVTAGELLSLCRRRGSLLSRDALDRIESLKRGEAPPEDKWARR